jgi:hypothetical protein
MATLLEFEADGERVLIDVTPPGTGVRAAGAADAVIKKAEGTFDQALRVAGSIARSFQRIVDECGLAHAELELGFQFTGKGNIYIVQSEGQAALKVKVNFSGPGSPSSPS